MFGFTGKLLEVNLTSNEIKTVALEENFLRESLGGSGLGVLYLWDKINWKADALSEENILGFFNGPLTGSSLPGVPRFSVCAKSPLSGIWGESNCGGYFGPELKFAGYDGIVIYGKAEKLVYISIENDKVEIKDALFLKGKDTYETEDKLQELPGGKKAKVACIGPAGENLVLFAGIFNDKGDTAGRAGLGAVMGSKNLKAIVVKGTNKYLVPDTEKFSKFRKSLSEKVMGHIAIDALKAYGTAGTMTILSFAGDVPVKYWELSEWDEGMNKINGLVMADTILVKTKSCFACPVSCKRVIEVKDGPFKTALGPGPEYETLGALGTLLYNSSQEAIAKANEICNKLGMDTISCGGVISFATYLYNEGIINKDITGGLDLSWGNAEDIIKLIEQIGKREGWGKILSLGIKKACEHLPAEAKKFAVEVKGMEMPMHDPRAYTAMALAYATSTRGACHMQSTTLNVEMGIGYYPEIDINGPIGPSICEGKGKITAQTQDIGAIINSIGLCMHVAIPLNLTDIADMLNATTGLNYKPLEILKLGEKLWNLKRLINFACGNTAKDDYLPEKILKATQNGPTQGFELPFEAMLKEYYTARNFGEDGLPLKEKMEELGLENYREKLNI